MYNLLLQLTYRFQLTRSRGARRVGSKSDVLDVPDFNSRAHVERDSLEDYVNPKKRISTHALTWSATQRLKNILFKVLFQLTRSRGARRRNIGEFCWPCRFQLTRSRGARPENLYINLCVNTHFNSRAHVERDTAIHVL